MRTANDAVRSMKKYLAEVLGDDWEVRLWSDEGTFVEPFARIAESSPTTYSSRRLWTDITKALQIHLYPPAATSTSAAMTVARDLEQVLVGAIELGIGLGWPRRIPLWDYDGVSLEQGSDTRETYDFMRVTDFTVTSIQDTDDPNRVVVVADVRVTWPQMTTVDPGHKTVESLAFEERAS